MSVLRTICSHQKGNLLNLVTGRRLVKPALGSGTLDLDDVAIAKEWLSRPTRWNDLKVVNQLETSFARWNGSAFSFAFMGGRDALSACIYALELQPEDEVIVPGYTCVVVPNAFRYENISVKFADIELETFGLDIASVQQMVTDRTKCILLQHLYGLVSRDYEAVLQLARERGIRLIEDCAHATGADWRGRRVGNLGDVAFYSSEQSKVFCTGQGGIAVTNDPKLAERMREYRDRAPFPSVERTQHLLKTVILNFYRYKHPRRWYWQDLALLKYGTNELISTTPEELKGIKPAHYGARMCPPIAAIAVNQLRKIDSYNQMRRENSVRWDYWCEANLLRKPLVLEQSTPVYLRYPVLVDPERKVNTEWASRELGVELGVWFLSHLHPVPSELEDCPNAGIAVKRCVNLPCLLN